MYLMKSYASKTQLKLDYNILNQLKFTFAHFALHFCMHIQNLLQSSNLTQLNNRSHVIFNAPASNLIHIMQKGVLQITSQIKTINYLKN